MKEYSLKEELVEQAYRLGPSPDSPLAYLNAYEVEIKIGELTREEVEEIRDFVREMVSRPSALEGIERDLDVA